MSRTRTLAELRGDVCAKADIVDGGAGGRFPSARLNRFINQAIQRYITIVTGAGGQEWYMQRTGLQTMGTSETVDASGWAPNQYVTLPTAFYQLIGIDIVIGGSTVSLLNFERAERNMFKDSPIWMQGNGKGQPMFFRIVGTNAAGAHIAQVVPAADAAYQYEVWYVPEIADLVGDNDTFDGRAGFEEFVVLEACLYCLQRDANVAPAYAALQASRDEMKAQMKFKFATMDGPGRRINTEALRNRMMRFIRGHWWGT